MGVRREEESRLTIALAFVDAHIANAEQYLAKKEALRDEAAAVARDFLDADVAVAINTADDPPTDLYLTVTGRQRRLHDSRSCRRRTHGFSDWFTVKMPGRRRSGARRHPSRHVSA